METGGKTGTVSMIVCLFDDVRVLARKRLGDSACQAGSAARNSSALMLSQAACGLHS
jgi:hypothetical protein